ncbi:MULTISPECIES: leucine-rich repeat protein [unclassified Enterococcus]|uniref:leucine-rich repeat protein n=1 Tax=unclassified Enterococcus TaxID=2608891 RepID=UPI001554B69F|nr:MULTISPECIES: leucine-rich repeat protein [unclassified Enterococcus]MBS7576937.1 leucine-rich repeat protein [Enterococcus sp. MMGLQ5-2]MBS7584344.1 leucine-rich repeat protein [Enterococcus sp. MMGLQ5-1]NPD12199.1 leucine-rich repeat protein [Enterococcus sp. MMGLQ5-1]NPD36771.1 leucine-rich repeat protein [Enterococcus sp. MMGLQ5-2]
MLYHKKILKISMLLILFLGLLSPLLSFAEMVETEDNQTINDDEIRVQDAADSSFSNTTIETGANPDEGTPGIQYNEDYTVVTGYTGTATDVVIPSGIISIDKLAFQSKQLTSVVLPESLTTIGYGAFSINHLTSIDIPNSVTAIGEASFYYNELTSVVLPESLTTIGQGAFIYNELTSVVFPESLTTIGQLAFAYNRLTSITVTESVSTLGSQIFVGQSSSTMVARKSTYTSSDLGISTFYQENQLVTFSSQTAGVIIDGTVFQLDSNFTGNQFIVNWNSWDGQHSGELTVELIESLVIGTINYQDELGNLLLDSRDISSQVGSTFNWLTPENITGYQVDYSKSTMVSKSDNGTEQITLTNLMTTSNSSTIEELIDYLSSKEIEDGMFSININYVYTKIPVKAADVTIRYVDTDDNSIVDEKVLIGNIGDAFTTEKLNIDGYTFKEIQGNATGIFTNQAQTVTYIYVKDSELDQLTKSTDNYDQNKIGTGSSKTNADSNDNKQLPMTNSINEIFIALIGLLFILSIPLFIVIKRNPDNK